MTRWIWMYKIIFKIHKPEVKQGFIIGQGLNALTVGSANGFCRLAIMLRGIHQNHGIPEGSHSLLTVITFTADRKKSDGYC